jgi:PEP-CTERM motif
MIKSKLGHMVRATLAITALAGAQLAAAQAGAGSVVTLGNGPGTVAGVYTGSVVSGPGAGTSFLSFCLERYEYFSGYGVNLFVQGVTDHTVNASSGPEYNLNNHQITDPLGASTAWLFTQFSAGTLAGYNPLAAESSNNSLQRAIWNLEGEMASTEAQFISDTQARTWVTAANAAVTSGAWSGLGNVRVLNLFNDRAMTSHSQDQIYMVSSVPEPETYGMMLAGLGLMGAIARRRTKAKEA